jgi:hypothetical protein
MVNEHFSKTWAEIPLLSGTNIGFLKSVHQVVMHTEKYTNRYTFTYNIENYKQKKHLTV